tara:strand:- start:21 stop:317 length:297 start_codon:yes stop_codon:yes gene_type:complete
MGFGKIYESTWWGVGVCAATNGWGNIYYDISGCASETAVAFRDRILADGGTVESLTCIDEKLKADYYADLTQAFIDRVIADSGKYEAAQCIDEKLQLT